MHTLTRLLCGFLLVLHLVAQPWHYRHHPTDSARAVHLARHPSAGHSDLASTGSGHSCAFCVLAAAAVTLPRALALLPSPLPQCTLRALPQTALALVTLPVRQSRPRAPPFFS